MQQLREEDDEQKQRNKLSIDSCKAGILENELYVIELYKLISVFLLARLSYLILLTIIEYLRVLS